MIIREWYHADKITTLVDFYAFQGVHCLTKNALENKIADAVAKKGESKNFDFGNFIPYVQMHEFEGLLFSNVEKFECVLDAWNDSVHQKLLKIRSDFETPKDINDKPETAPSKRILNVFPPGGYKKFVHGPLIARNIGLSVIREECPQFDVWVKKLEVWGTLGYV